MAKGRHVFGLTVCKVYYKMSLIFILNKMHLLRLANVSHVSHVSLV